jgi:hypothetical protein
MLDGGHVRIDILAVQVSPITACMPPNKINRMDFVDLTERHGRWGDDHLSKFKERHVTGYA